MYEQSGMTVEQMSNILYESKQIREQQEYEIRKENSMLKKENEQLKEQQLKIRREIDNLNLEKNKKISEIVSLKEEI